MIRPQAQPNVYYILICRQNSILAIFDNVNSCPNGHDLYPEYYPELKGSRRLHQLVAKYRLKKLRGF